MQISRPEQLTEFLTQLGRRFPHAAAIYIFGGSAIVWLGGPRHTGDIDYTAAPPSAALRQAIAQTAAELGLDLEDAAFLIAAGRIDLTTLERYVEDVAARYDEPIKLRRNLAEFKRKLKP